MKLSPLNFVHLNGYYSRSDARETVYQLYKGICQGCEKPITDTEEFHVGHIVPQSHPEEFEKRYPGLDVDNLLNLHLLHGRCNMRQSNVFLASEFRLSQMHTLAAKAITNRLAKISGATPTRTPSIARARNALTGMDSKLCTLGSSDSEQEPRGRTPLPLAYQWIQLQLQNLLRYHEEVRIQSVHSAIFCDIGAREDLRGIRPLAWAQGAAPLFANRCLTVPDGPLVSKTQRGHTCLTPAPGTPWPRDLLDSAVYLSEQAHLLNFEGALLIPKRQLLTVLDNCIEFVLFILEETDGTMTTVVSPCGRFCVQFPYFPGLAKISSLEAATLTMTSLKHLFPPELLLSGLFRPGAGPRETNLDWTRVTASPGICIWYKGEELRQDDQRVLLQLGRVPSDRRVEPSQCVPLRSFATNVLGWADSGDSSSRLIASLERLVTAKVRIDCVAQDGAGSEFTNVSPSSTYFGFLEAVKFTDRGFTVTLDSRFLELLGRTRTGLATAARFKLGDGLSSWLWAYIQSANCDYPLCLEGLRNISYKTNYQSKEFTRAIKAALDELMVAKLIKGYEVVTPTRGVSRGVRIHK